MHSTLKHKPQHAYTEQLQDELKTGQARTPPSQLLC